MIFGRKKTSDPPRRKPAPPVAGSPAGTAGVGAARQPTPGAGAKISALPPRAPVAVLPGVKHTVAIASGKGGVGKSTVSVNLAVALAQAGARVGLLDADIYGPSIPKLLGFYERPLVQDGKMVPIEASGVTMMSLGLLVASDQPTIWRGPMVSQAVQQLLRDVAWGELDYLLIDLPPGTGDAQLTLSQVVKLSGVVIVSTPQDVALSIATRALQMFKQMRVPILGIVENMSYFVCSTCDARHEIFGHGGAQEACERLKVPFLGEIPLHQAIRESGDNGKALATVAPESPESKAFADVATNLARQVGIQARRTLPLLQVAVE